MVNLRGLYLSKTLLRTNCSCFFELIKIHISCSLVSVANPVEFGVLLMLQVKERDHFFINLNLQKNHSRVFSFSYRIKKTKHTVQS